MVNTKHIKQSWNIAISKPQKISLLQYFVWMAHGVTIVLASKINIELFDILSLQSWLRKQIQVYDIQLITHQLHFTWFRVIAPSCLSFHI